MLPLPQTCVQECSKVGMRIYKIGLRTKKLGVLSMLLQFCGIIAIPETRQMKFCQKQTIVGP